MFGSNQLAVIPEGGTVDLALAVLSFFVILASAFGVVRHAEALAHRYGDPWGTLVLTLSVTSVEVLMIATIMLNGDRDPTVARDTMVSTLLLLLAGMIGLVLLAGGIRHGEQRHNWRSSTAFLSVIGVAIALAFVLPMVELGDAERHLELFLIPACLVLFAAFTRVQTREHRGYFQLAGGGAEHPEAAPDGLSGARHALSLVATIFFIAWLAEDLARGFDLAVAALDLPPPVAGFAVAVLIVTPEGLTAFRAGLRNELQRVVNIVLGSAVATLLLTIPAVVTVGLVSGRAIELALDPEQAVLLGATFLNAMLTFKGDETNVLQGVLHLVLFAAFVGTTLF